ncbi:MAG: hypothetical protein N2260_10145 [Syntrophobacterales bacterium]|nr:hypothetical protein [Syntrophobacterales bacterium]
MKNKKVSSEEVSLDITLDLPLTEEQMLKGGEIEVVLPHSPESKTVEVKIPPGVKPGIRIRLRGLGLISSRESKRGDLYLRIKSI